MLRPITDRLAAVAAALSDDPRQAPRLARQLGLRGILYPVISPRLDITQLSISGRREFRQAVTAQDQELAGFQLDLGPKGLSPGADVDREIARLDRAMDAAAGMVAPMVCVDLGPLPAARMTESPRSTIPPADAGLIIIPQSAPAPIAPPPAAPDPAFVSQLAAALAEIGSRADRYSVILAFSSSLASMASLSQAILDARCPWFGFDLDPLAMLRDDWDSHQIFSAIGPLIRHARAKDGQLGDAKRIKPAIVGKGDVKWEQLISLLDEAGYQGFLTIDPLELPDRDTGVRAAAEHLRGMVR